MFHAKAGIGRERLNQFDEIYLGNNQQNAGALINARALLAFVRVECQIGPLVE